MLLEQLKLLYRVSPGVKSAVVKSPDTIREESRREVIMEAVAGALESRWSLSGVTLHRLRGDTVPQGLIPREIMVTISLSP